MTAGAVEVVDAELVNDDCLPSIVASAPDAHPVVDRHTILYPGQNLPTDADQPTYTERDLYVSERTKEWLENQSAPKNTSANYRSQRNQFAWCTEQGRVARPCTTATYIEYVAHLIDAGRSPNAINAAMSAIRTWMPEDKKPGTKQARGMLNEYKKTWAKRTAVRRAPPVTDDLLRAMVATCDLRTNAGRRDRCMLLLGRGALNRRIELADLCIADRPRLQSRAEELAAGHRTRAAPWRRASYCGCGRRPDQAGPVEGGQCGREAGVPGQGAVPGREPVVEGADKAERQRLAPRWSLWGGRCDVLDVLSGSGQPKSAIVITEADLHARPSSMAVCWYALMPGVDTDAVEVEFIGAHAVGGPGGQARAAEAGQVGALRTGGTAAPEPVVPEPEGFEVWQSIVWVDEETVTPSGGHRNPSAGSQQLAPVAAGEAAGCSGDDERGAPRVGVDGVAPEGDGGASPTGLLVPASIWVIDVGNDRERHQVPGERSPALGAVEDSHTSGSTVCQAGPSRGIRLADRRDSYPTARHRSAPVVGESG